MHVRTILLAAAAFGLTACTTADQTASTASMTPADGRDCFRTASVTGYSVVDDHNIRVRLPGRSYTLHTTWNANDLDWTQSLALRSDTGWICTGNTLGAVEVTGGHMNRTYPIQSVSRDTDPPGQEGS